jgi:hypothetical protein
LSGPLKQQVSLGPVQMRLAASTAPHESISQQVPFTQPNSLQHSEPQQIWPNGQHLPAQISRLPVQHRPSVQRPLVQQIPSSASQQTWSELQLVSPQQASCCDGLQNGPSPPGLPGHGARPSGQQSPCEDRRPPGHGIFNSHVPWMHSSTPGSQHSR